jgi:hypothetical protein
MNLGMLKLLVLELAAFNIHGNSFSGNSDRGTGFSALTASYLSILAIS